MGRGFLVGLSIAISGCTPFIGAGVGTHFHKTNTHGQYPAMIEAGVEFKAFELIGLRCTPDVAIMHISHIDKRPPDTTSESVFASARCRYED
jgi:hypothetical protein